MIEIFPSRKTPDEELQIKVITGLMEKQKASLILSRLSEVLPLQRIGLGHLKRARKPMSEDNTNNQLEVMLAPISLIDQIPLDITSLLKSTKELITFKVAPESKEEWERWNPLWPMYHRPSDLQRSRMQGCSIDDIRKARNKFERVKHDALQYGHHNNHNHDDNSQGAVVINPNNGKVIMSSYRALQHLIKDQSEPDLYHNHPLYTPVLLCIHGVAEIICKRLEPDDGQEALPSDPYLCTGLEFYLMREPDLMSSMALIHSRVKTVVFRDFDKKNGGTGTHFHIHDNRQLNHRYRVYQLNDEEED